MSNRRTRKTGQDRVQSDPLDWVGSINGNNLAKNGAQELTQPQSKLIEQKQEKTMSEVKTSTPSDQSHTTEASGVENVNYAQVINNLSSCVQIADTEGVIIYMNAAVEKMFAEAESEIRKQLPQFDSKKLLGQNIDLFHKNPTHQRNILANLKAPVRATIKLGACVFDLVCSPLFDAEGRSAGAMVEWMDITIWNNLTGVVDGLAQGDLSIPLVDEARCEGVRKVLRNAIGGLKDNINALVVDANALSEAAVKGRLTTRADISQHQGEFRNVIEGVNNTLDAVIEPLNNLSVVIEQLGVNNLDVSFSGEYQGDFRRIKDTFDIALNAMNTTLRQVVEAVDQVTRSASQLSVASQTLAATVEEQASSIEEVTASLEETDSQVKANTDNANAANQLVIEASKIAGQGLDKMVGMVSAMGAINQSSQDIAKIIKVIDEIAFQTNLLALNAAVEAARAGQHGRGFAVVAQEVRNLAGRSAKAARETADMIEGSSKRVAEGVAIADDTRLALDLIVTNVTKVKDLVAEIAVASAEQSTGVSQINEALSQISKATQEGSQQAEEMAMSSSELTHVADRMGVEVGRFKLSQAVPQVNDLDLNGLTPDTIRQLIAMLTAQQASGTAVPPSVAGGEPTSKKTARAKSPKSVLPLDADERGYGHF